MSLQSVLPLLFQRGWWDIFDYPQCIMDQCFGNELHENDLLPSFPTYRGTLVRSRTQANIDASGKSMVKKDDNHFEVALDVSQFKPEDLEVKIVGNFVVIHGKHNEKNDENALVSREFKRRYMLPRNCETDMITPSLGSDGILKIRVPKKVIQESKDERIVPISKEEPKSVEYRKTSSQEEITTKTSE
ncbi:alpha-crystallin A chain-like [Stegodyphus dumicola]|uniref:alpha-crystallin A chain-like n=1 Tax=Stegodyphus dumicola TaxID=202533 RepID=UPI0015AD6A0B|nr:alpha-crystallin A chain-like [Stegodyphus dumicola]